MDLENRSFTMTLNCKGNHLKSEHLSPVWLSKRLFRSQNAIIICQQHFLLREPRLRGHSNHKSTAPYFLIKHYWSTWAINLSAASSSDRPCLTIYTMTLLQISLFANPTDVWPLLPAPHQCSTRNVTEGIGKRNTEQISPCF